MGHPLYDLMTQLEHQKVYFTIRRHRSECVTLTIRLAGERVEIDVFADGQIEYLRFTGSEEVLDDLDALQQLIRGG